MNKAICPNPECNGEDYSYMSDDLTCHKCGVCGTTWKTYDPENKIKECFDIVINKE